MPWWMSHIDIIVQATLQGVFRNESRFNLYHNASQVHVCCGQLGDYWQLWRTRAKWGKSWSLCNNVVPSIMERAVTMICHHYIEILWDQLLTWENLAFGGNCVRPRQRATAYYMQNNCLSWTAQCRGDGLACSKSRHESLWACVGSKVYPD